MSQQWDFSDLHGSIWGSCDYMGQFWSSVTTGVRFGLLWLHGSVWGFSDYAASDLGFNFTHINLSAILLDILKVEIIYIPTSWRAQRRPSKQILGTGRKSVSEEERMEHLCLVLCCCSQCSRPTCLCNPIHRPSWYWSLIERARSLQNYPMREKTTNDLFPEIKLNLVFRTFPRY